MPSRILDSHDSDSLDKRNVLGDGVFFDDKAYVIRGRLDGTHRGVIESDGTMDGSQLLSPTSRIESLGIFGDSLVGYGDGKIWIKEKSDADFRFLADGEFFSIASESILFQQSSAGLLAVDRGGNQSRLPFDDYFAISPANLAGEETYVIAEAFAADSIVQRLYSTDGTVDGTQLVHQEDTSRSISHTAEGSGYFAVRDDLARTSELWRIEEANASASQVFSWERAIGKFQFAGGRLHVLTADSSCWVVDTEGVLPIGTVHVDGDFIAINDMDVVFVGSESGEDQELWTSDGTLEGTRELYDAFPQTQSSDFESPEAQQFVSFQGYFYFAANGKLLRTDGTETAPQVVHDFSDDGQGTVGAIW